jgi:hypothetical protein
VIEITTFRLRDGVINEAFVAEDEQIQMTCWYLQPGLQRRTTAVSADGGWVTITVWDSAAHADAATGSLDPQSALAMIDVPTIETRRYETF